MEPIISPLEAVQIQVRGLEDRIKELMEAFMKQYPEAVLTIKGDTCTMQLANGKRTRWPQVHASVTI